MGRCQRLRSWRARSRAQQKSSSAASEPGSFRLRGTFKRPKGKANKATKVHVHPCCRLEAQARPCPRTRSRIQDREPDGAVQVEASLAASRSELLAASPCAMHTLVFSMRFETRTTWFRPVLARLRLEKIHGEVVVKPISQHLSPRTC